MPVVGMQNTKRRFIYRDVYITENILYSKLESLRGVAACLVILFHSNYSFYRTSTVFVNNSYLFVDLFFIISGFVLSYAYADKIRNGLALNKYLVLRLGRIYPLHIFMLFIFVLYVSLKVYFHSIGVGAEQKYDNNNIGSFFTNIFLIHSIGMHDYLTWNKPSWSISVEFFTYIIFFLVLKSVDKSNSLVLPIIISILGYGYLVQSGKPNLDITYDLGIARCVAGFYLGVFLFRVSPRLRIIKTNITLAEFVSFVFVAVSVSVADRGWGFQLLSLASFMFAVLIFSNSKSGLLGRLFHSMPMRTIGIWSYSIYMVHYIVLALTYDFVRYFVKIEPSSIGGVASIIINTTVIIIIISISRFSYIYIEDKYRKLAKLTIKNIGK